MPTSSESSEPRDGEAPAGQAQRLESLGRLAAGLAHDYGNALTVILSCARSMEQALAAGRPVAPDDVRQVAAAAERAEELTRQLRAFARRQASSPAPLDLGAALARWRGALARRLGEGVELELITPPDLWPVRADPAQLEQALLNLAARARDALPRGGRVRVEAVNLSLAAGDPAWPDLSPGDHLRLSFADDGPGLAPELRGREFDPFLTGKGDGLGAGLRLAAVHGIVVQGGGRIRVESAPGGGTRFELLLPRGEAPAPAPGPWAAEPEPAGGTETILLVEDDPAVRRQALRALAGAGYHVHVASDGEEALALAPTLAEPPHLLLTDVVMPRVDGPRLAEALLGRWPALRVVFTSGYTEEPPAAGGRGAFLQKPFTVRALLGRIRATLDGAPGA